ncbi:5-formyltetrahydrofolate cyclo-ligase [Parendozoicomonas sp. Alg238-R29]|uniref:5-formyltetrahydrofolate cyclo-ligase n=1 Tax=Parendozoicomonas sp. Alg238-R29 TaxID=2993446 RepID=UPI00248F3BB8|nr:5-formyltetrahydrofolate cyclo-ligase [Parendozoicomonas sp. Alg238-R29]
MNQNNNQSPEHVKQQKSDLRKQLREKRRSLSPDQQQTAAQNLFENLLTHPAYTNSEHIAVYLARDGEIDLKFVVEDARKKGKKIYLPVVDSQGSGTLTFLPWEDDTIMVKNEKSFGIPEPDSRLYEAHPVQDLDLVLLPLTGFDPSGKRIGMGGGFYDRTFAFINKDTKSSQPLLIGVAHECQKVDNIPSESWDIPLMGIATNLHYYS